MMTMQERIENDPNGNLIQNMIKSKDIPDNILMEYFKVKTLLDRISGQVTPAVLAMIILKAQGGVTNEQSAVNYLKRGNGRVPAQEAPAETETVTENVELDDELEEEPEEEVVPEPELEAEPWPEDAVEKGTKGKAFYGNDIHDCEVVNAYMDGVQLTYQIEMDGEDDPVAILAENFEAE